MLCSLRDRRSRGSRSCLLTGSYPRKGELPDRERLVGHRLRPAARQAARPADQARSGPPPPARPLGLGPACADAVRRRPRPWAPWPRAPRRPPSHRARPDRPFGVTRSGERPGARAFGRRRLEREGRRGQSDRRRTLLGARTGEEHRASAGDRLAGGAGRPPAVLVTDGRRSLFAETPPPLHLVVLRTAKSAIPHTRYPSRSRDHPSFGRGTSFQG